MSSKVKETNENEAILKTLIKSWENLEEKLGTINYEINTLESELKGGLSEKEV